jgi:hypothetical protein
LTGVSAGARLKLVFVMSDGKPTLPVLNLTVVYRPTNNEFAMASGEMTDEAFRAFLSETLGACARVSRDGAVHFVCMDWRHMDDVAAVGKQVYGDLLNLCFWNKSNAGMGSLYRSKHELIFVYRVWRDASLPARLGSWGPGSVSTVGSVTLTAPSAG